jgi:hypothetical protein
MCYQPPGTGICVTFSHLGWGDASPWRARNTPHCLAPGYKRSAPSFLVRPRAAVVRHRCSSEDFPVQLTPAPSEPLLAPLLAHLEPTRARVALAEPPARRSTSSRDRRQAATGEPHSPLELRSSQPFQDLHWVAGKLTVPHVVQPRPYPHQSPSSRNRRRRSPLSPLVGATPTLQSVANQP